MIRNDVFEKAEQWDLEVKRVDKFARTLFRFGIIKSQIEFHNFKRQLFTHGEMKYQIRGSDVHSYYIHAGKKLHTAKHWCYK